MCKLIGLIARAYAKYTNSSKLQSLANRLSTPNGCINSAINSSKTRQTITE